MSLTELFSLKVKDIPCIINGLKRTGLCHNKIKIVIYYTNRKRKKTSNKKRKKYCNKRYGRKRFKKKIDNRRTYYMRIPILLFAPEFKKL